jgi:hypothetical protein
VLTSRYYVGRLAISHKLISVVQNMGRHQHKDSGDSTRRCSTENQRKKPHDQNIEDNCPPTWNALLEGAILNSLV